MPLADCSYIDRAENILISGATGSGKSFLACAFGHQACQTLMALLLSLEVMVN
jgi:DNA replication protein DnaC